MELEASGRFSLKKSQGSLTFQKDGPATTAKEWTERGMNTGRRPRWPGERELKWEQCDDSGLENQSAGDKGGVEAGSQVSGLSTCINGGPLAEIRKKLV